MRRVVLRRGVDGACAKKAALPGTMAELLELATKKLELATPAKRIFGADGGEYDPDDLDLIEKDEVLYVTCGEAYAPLTQSALSQATSLMSSDATPSEATLDRTPTNGLPAAIPTPLSHIPSTLSSASSAGVSSFTSQSLGPPAALHAHLTVMQAAPLVCRGSDGHLRPLQVLNTERERETLLDTLRNTGREISVHFDTATADALRMCMTKGTTILHWSGHGQPKFMAFEDGCGGTHELSPELLASTCMAGDSRLSCKLVFVCACHSQPTAAAFGSAGVPHVVAVRSDALVLDHAAVTFTKHFYLSLFSGQGVKTAFDVAQAAVRAMPSRLTASLPAALESQKFVLMGAGDHTEPIFGELPLGELVDRSRALCPSNVPAPSEIFVGRQRQLQQAVAALAGKRRCVVLVGAGGIGKTALAACVCSYVRLRHIFPDGVVHCDARALQSVLSLTYAIASAFSLPLSVECSEARANEELIGAPATKHALVRQGHAPVASHALPCMDQTHRGSASLAQLCARHAPPTPSRPAHLALLCARPTPPTPSHPARSSTSTAATT